MRRIVVKRTIIVVPDKALRDKAPAEPFTTRLKRSISVVKDQFDLLMNQAGDHLVLVDNTDGKYKNYKITIKFRRLAGKLLYAIDVTSRCYRDFGTDRTVVRAIQRDFHAVQVFRHCSTAGSVVGVLKQKIKEKKG